MRTVHFDNDVDDYETTLYNYILFKTYMHSSFQNTGYNHALQTQILGPSGLKIFAG